MILLILKVKLNLQQQQKQQIGVKPSPFLERKTFLYMTFATIKKSPYGSKNESKTFFFLGSQHDCSLTIYTKS